MKKYIIGAVIVAALGLYIVFSNQNNSVITTPQTPNTTTTPIENDGGGTGTGPVNTPTPNPAPSPAPTPSPTPTPKPNPVPNPTGYKDGIYTGAVADAFYGNLQVTATIRNGMLADIQFPQYPQDPGETALVNNSALPTLKQEAIASQSANVDTVSGATQTSEAFRQTLASALAKAKA